MSYELKYHKLCVGSLSSFASPLILQNKNTCPLLSVIVRSFGSKKSLTDGWFLGNSLLWRLKTEKKHDIVSQLHFVDTIRVMALTWGSAHDIFGSNFSQRAIFTAWSIADKYTYSSLIFNDNLLRAVKCNVRATSSITKQPPSTHLNSCIA